jgi:hypothetical protein
MELPASETFENTLILTNCGGWLVRINIELNDRERREAAAAKGFRTWRDVLLNALNVYEEPRLKGRPRRE